MIADLPADIQIKIAEITANATIQAARVAADASRINAIITAGGTVVGLLGTVLAAYLAYQSATAPERRAAAEREKEKAVLLNTLRADVRHTIKFVNEVLVTYTGKFEKPVTLRVLSLPETVEVLALDPKRLAQLDTVMTEAIATVRRTLDDYKRAKAPIETQWRLDLGRTDDSEVHLSTRPDSFGEVITQAEAYRAALNHLERVASRT